MDKTKEVTGVAVVTLGMLGSVMAEAIVPDCENVNGTICQSSPGHLPDTHQGEPERKVVEKTVAEVGTPAAIPFQNTWDDFSRWPKREESFTESWRNNALLTIPSSTA